MPDMTAEQIVQVYNTAKSNRSPHESDWRKAAAYVLPAQYASWQSDGPILNGRTTEAARRVAFDTTGARSLPKYASVLERMATPSGQAWHALTASDTTLRRKHRVREYFDELTKLLFKYRLNPKARFRLSTNEMYGSMGTYGNGPLYIGERKRSVINPTAGFKYVACPFRDTFFLIDDEGNITTVFRRFWVNCRQFKLKFPNTAYPTQMQSEGMKPTPNENAYFEFVHMVTPRDEGVYDPDAIDARRHPYVGRYVCIKSKEFVGDETGFRSQPYKIPRTMTVSGDPYGYSPAVMALASLGGASAMKKTYLKQGQKAVDPPLLAHDDNRMNGQVDIRAGAVNYGGVDRNGKQMIVPLQTGDFRVAEALLADERGDTEDMFFVTLFQILTDTPEMTATEVMERVAEKAALLSPTMGRLQSEFLGPTIDREIDLLAEMGKLPEMPPELIEAEGEFDVVYTSPLAKSMYAEEVSGYMRSKEMVLAQANATGDLSGLDWFNDDDALPEIADYMAVPARWMNDPDTVKQKRETRARQEEQAQVMQNAPALASAAKTASEMQGGAQ